MYGMRALPYMMMEPSSVQPITYESANCLVQTQFSLVNIQWSVMKLVLGLKADMHFDKCCWNCPDVKCHGPNMPAPSLAQFK